MSNFLLHFITSVSPVPRYFFWSPTLFIFLITTPLGSLRYPSTFSCYLLQSVLLAISLFMRSLPLLLSAGQFWDASLEEEVVRLGWFLSLLLQRWVSSWYCQLEKLTTCSPSCRFVFLLHHNHSFRQGQNNRNTLKYDSNLNTLKDFKITTALHQHLSGSLSKTSTLQASHMGFVERLLYRTAVHSTAVSLVFEKWSAGEHKVCYHSLRSKR